ncbi:hypothetical protein H112_03538 [Trichophyton rubrum D6]|uniref:Uncharacterized protein n=2 Tax=Trichophyton TaxID=5550 RepID=A0A022W5F9_TRIRU|nr:hypothetical protein H100_03542 [Trichophyton rubrum MR850]EZF42917.1 hypothetical protein H102_03536 [Trichophyton rubrum CBS 100081]EZF53567.1 hypothetical protein H103_03547 [Trichophyton rubrum CBS 288.86]EZF64156.1 hypothetical protein H104_03533 [Trichophyton rubrum CBS 289.86]EZF74769.1 hypothetical protein H105_03561 [Trichophyton soudanense CBS 452.61]EZF85433.1 hypothetical protein H110_03544 [Trichophyton rubrum MR1448]EZF96211.1 hypothetical protein H113_03565 [Trichophyton rub
MRANYSRPRAVLFMRPSGPHCPLAAATPGIHDRQRHRHREAGRMAGRSVCIRARQDALCWLVRSGSRGLVPAIELHRQRRREQT